MHPNSGCVLTWCLLMFEGCACGLSCDPGNSPREHMSWLCPYAPPVAGSRRLTLRKMRCELSPQRTGSSCCYTTADCPQTHWSSTSSSSSDMQQQQQQQQQRWPQAARGPAEGGDQQQTRQQQLPQRSCSSSRCSSKSSKRCCCNA
jgi:hypothetical protein